MNNSFFKKFFLRFFLIHFIFFLGISITGCSNTSIEKTPQEIFSEFEKTLQSDKYMVKGSSKSLKRFFGINAKDIDSFLLYTPKSNMDVDEVLVLKVKNSSQLDSIENAIDERVNTQLKNFSGYGAEQCSLLQDYEVKIKGDYIFYGVGKNVESLKKTFKSLVQ